MAGVTDRVFRRLALEFGAAFTWTEMISAKGLLMKNHRTLDMLCLDQDQKTGIQLFGSDPGEMAEAGVFAAGQGAAAIDINMGCPASKVLKGGAGAALLRDVPKACAIVRAVAAAVKIPVTVKVRKGWDDDPDFGPLIVSRLAEAGAVAVTVHGRTPQQGFHGRADWDYLARVKAEAPIPVIGNGDVFNAADARAMKDHTGCDAIMLGRGALGNPWLFSSCSAVLSGRAEPAPPDPAARMKVAERHLDLMVEAFGEEKGVARMRKHLAWYFRAFPGAARMRRETLTLPSAGEVKRRLAAYACGSE